MELIDTHCHLSMPMFSQDLDAVIQRAAQHNVRRLIVVGVCPATSLSAVQIAERYNGLFAAVGIHPNEAHLFSENEFSLIASLAQNPRVVAIGETGLDFYRLEGLTDKGELQARIQAQLKMFRRHLELACDLHKPCVIHCRNALSAILEVVRQYGASLHALIHCFTEGPDQLKATIEAGLYVSFTGVVTYRSAGELRESVRQCPADRFFLETDAPFLTPAPYRGIRCEPKHVCLTAEKIAEARRQAVELVAEQTTANAERFFRL